ncbi:uncharacterized protein [Prorops nasuta]|uniref:uncharacterized protein isoform X2 n=1 Tax=Prorops nasuta TaxID=863751 RepID=UPI0034CD32DC
MSRPILSRPRTRVYGCNYDKGESYYKPMVDHLDRKYSARPLFAEPRNTFADEIAARRNDFGGGDTSGPLGGSLGRDLDLEFDSRRQGSRLSPSSRPAGYDPLADDDELVFDSRGQRTRRRLGEDFASEVAATTRRFKARVAELGFEDESSLLDPATTLGASRRGGIQAALRSALDDTETREQRRSRIFEEEPTFPEPRNVTRWTKLQDEEDPFGASAAATRARQTKARLDDLESEMEEIAERQAKRERRAAALRALVNESTASAIADEDLSVSKKVSSSSISSSTLRSNLQSEKHVTF